MVPATSGLKWVGTMEQLDVVLSGWHRLHRLSTSRSQLSRRPDKKSHRNARARHAVRRRRRRRRRRRGEGATRPSGPSWRGRGAVAQQPTQASVRLLSRRRPTAQRGFTMGKSRAVMARLGAALSLGVLVIALVAGTGASAAPSASTPGSSVPTVGGGVKGQPGYLVYWDQNEEVDFLSMPKGTQGQLLPAWDLNGQMCVLPGGRFVGGYDPTLPSQHNLGGLKPYKQPADGEELDEPERFVQWPDPVRARDSTRCAASPSAATLHRVPTASSTTTRPIPGAWSTVVTTSSPTTLRRPRVITRRRAAAAWSNGSPRITRRTASCTAPMRGA